MGQGCDTVREWASNFFHWIYPERIDAPECVRKTLESIYPTVDWGSVTFHDGIPWIFRLGNPAAITLPATFGAQHINIYFDSGQWDPCTCAGMSTIVHEGFHVLQYRDILGGWGLGFLRPFIVAYLSCSVTGGGGSGNLIEGPAYAQEEAFRKCCYASGSAGPICNCKEQPPAFNQDALDLLLKNCPSLVRTSSGIDFWQVFGQCLPAGAGLHPVIRFLWYAIWLALWVSITGLVAVVKALADIALLTLDGLVWVVAGIVCAAEWLWDRLEDLWNWLAGLPGQICDWAVELEEQCAEWEETWSQRCEEWEETGYDACAQWRDDGYNKCTETRDDGYNACSQWDQQCCTWWPCSWGCKALTAVCVFWFWFSNIVCVAYVWVRNLVCVLWVWVSSLVCKVWVWAVSTTCKAFTWVVKTVTCW